MSPTPSLPNLISYLEFKKAFASCRRRETRKPDGTIRQRAGALSYLFMQTRVSSSTTLDAAAGTKTASWKFVSRGGRGYHDIKVNPECANAFFDETRGNPARRIDLTKAVIAHETCHGLYTSRTEDVGRACHDLKLPFRLLNLMEDCRIEWKYVKDRGKEHRFRWNLFDDKLAKPSGSGITSPMEWLYVMKTREPVLYKSLSSVMTGYGWGCAASLKLPSVTYSHQLKIHEGKIVNFRQLINFFYGEIVNAATTEHLLPLVRYWVDIFGKESSSELPPIIVDTVPDSIGGIKDAAEADGGGGDSPDVITREVDHSPVTTSSDSGATAGSRSTVTPTKVTHHNTDAYLHHARHVGFIPLIHYISHRR